MRGHSDRLNDLADEAMGQCVGRNIIICGNIIILNILEEILFDYCWRLTILGCSSYTYFPFPQDGKRNHDNLKQMVA